MERLCECGAEEGQLHDFGCHREICPFCEASFAEGCGCQYDLLGLRSRLHSPQREGLSGQVFEGGLSPEQDARWKTILEARGRLPFLDKPLMCERCGVLWPDLFMVQDLVWEYYAGPLFRDSLLCEQCFREVREALDRYHPRPDWLPPDQEIEAYRKAWVSRDRATMQRLEPAKFQPGYQPTRMPRLGAS